MKKVLIVFGTRPEAIKMAPVIRAFRGNNTLCTRVCLTGQHREMADQVMELFSITPDYDLKIMKPNQTLQEITSAVLLCLPSILDDFQPDIMLVHGDTSSAMAASLTAFYRNIPVAHVEAGLRTWNNRSPFPEEMNRKIIANIASIHFAPTKQTADNLRRENIPEDNIVITGNTVIDALYECSNKALPEDVIDNEIVKLTSSGKKVILVTSHRRENFGDGINRICDAICALSEMRDVYIAYSSHLNPNVIEVVRRKLANFPGVFLLRSLDYITFVHLMRRSYIILTDSGGIQEEAPAFGKPVLVMRDLTERPEAVESGAVRLVGTNTQNIVNSVLTLLDDDEAYKAMSTAKNPYGDGKASEKILTKTLEWFHRAS